MIVRGFKKGFGRVAQDDAPKVKREILDALELNTDGSFYRYKEGIALLTEPRLYRVGVVFESYGIQDWADEIIDNPVNETEA